MQHLSLSLIDILVDKYYAFDGCSSNGLQVDPGFLSELSKAEIECCSLDGNSCSRKNGDICRSGDNDDYIVTWKEANQHCEDAGMRLCNTQQELDRCCGQGCSYDNQLVWSGQKEGNLSPVVWWRELQLECVSKVD